jgi:hypothetical protein
MGVGAREMAFDDAIGSSSLSTVGRCVAWSPAEPADISVANGLARIRARICGRSCARKWSGWYMTITVRRRQCRETELLAAGKACRPARKVPAPANRPCPPEATGGNAQSVRV